jgi:hypothetical protein
VVEEAESDALARLIDAEESEPVACLLLETELRRAMHRVPALTHAAVTELLGSVDCVVTYDTRLAGAAVHLGIEVIGPT